MLALIETEHIEDSVQSYSNSSATALNSSVPGIFELKFGYVIFKRTLAIDGWGISYEIVLIWISFGLH